VVSRIRVLTEDTINKIAAGEVIENPASVVKELTENSIDAGATDIVVEIVEGGRQMIRIIDNGCGMSKDDALLCLERHATSKLKVIDDIHAIHTMGFRGEAIPSIASISKFTLITRYHDHDHSDELGTFISVDGGKIINCTAVACEKGTTLEVKSLFFNVPVRKKFQKSPTSDVAEILRMVSLLALGHPEIKFRLISNKETLLMTLKPTGTTFHEILKERIKDVLGQEYSDNLLAVELVDPQCTIRGFVGKPSSFKHNRTGQHLFINKRGVQSSVVSYGVRDGFGTMIPTGKHPIYVLNLELEGENVDVNVHPQKREVRLRQEYILKGLVIRAVEMALQRKSISTQFDSNEETLTHNQDEPYPFEREAIVQPPKWNSSESYSDEKQHSSTYQFFNYFSDVDNDVGYKIPTNIDLCTQATAAMSDQGQHQAINQDTSEGICTKPGPAVQSFKFFEDTSPKPKFEVVASIPGHFVALKRDNEKLSLYIVDQRAAHARITYENLLKINETLPSQSLLIPYTLTLSPSDAALMQEQISYFQSAGIHIGEFGKQSFVIDALPAVFGNVDLQKLIDELLESLRENCASDQIEKERKKQIAKAASRSSVNSERTLSAPEAQLLIDQLVLCEIYDTCPYGKKTFVSFTPDQLSKLFFQ